MGIFGYSSPFDADIEKATSETNTSEKWGDIMDVCDKVGTSSVNAKDCLRSIVKRLAHADPHVVVQAITLMDACVNNCGKNFHLEIASREFETEYRRLLARSQPPVAQKLRCLLKKWAEGEFKTDPQLSLIPSFYQKLRSEGNDFTDVADSAPKPVKPLSTDPNVVSTQQEEDDIAKAIELSLKDKSTSPRAHTTSTNPSATSLYPSMAVAAAAPAPEARKVRALYDFEAAEDNELTFLAGEIIQVQDDSDPNWWKGYNQRGEGLFPANFVSADLSVEPEQTKIDSHSRKVQFNESVEVKTILEEASAVVEINEQSIDRLVHLLNEANPEDPSEDTDEMLSLEGQVNQMGPLIDNELERIDRKHAQLTQLSSDLVEALNLYHTLMREPERPLYNYQPQQQPMYPPRGFPGMPPPGMFQAMGGPAPQNMGPPISMGSQGPMGPMPSMGPMPPSMGPVNMQSQLPSNMSQMGLSNPNQVQHGQNPQMLPNPNQSLPPPASQMGPSQSQIQQMGPNPNMPHQMLPANSMIGPPHIIMVPNHNGQLIPQMGPMQTQLGPNDDPRQNIPYQPRMAPNHFVHGPTALPGHM